MISDFYEMLKRNMASNDSDQDCTIAEDGAVDVQRMQYYHPKFKKKTVFIHENGSRAETPVHWNYELQNDDRPGSKLVCFDENDDEISCDIEKRVKE